DEIKSQSNSQNVLAEKLGISKSAVSQMLNNPGNLGLETMVKYARAIGMKIAVVLYDKKNNKERPVHPDIFRICWEKLGEPRDFWALQELSARASSTAYLEKKGGFAT